MVDFVLAHPNIGAAISYHTHSGVILRPMGTLSDDDMIPEDLWSFKRFSALGAEAHRLPGREHLARLQVPPEGNHRRHAGLALRAPGRAVLGRRALVAEQGGRHQRLQVDRLVPRAPGRGRPEAAEVERRAVRRSGARRLEAVPAPAARRGRDRRLGQDELLAQPAAATARARSRAVSGLDEPARAEPAEARAAEDRGARPRTRHLARAHGGGQQRLAAGLREQARPGAQGRARRDVRDPPARRRPGDRRSSAASRVSKGRSSKAMRPRTRCMPSCRAARSRPIGRSPSGSCVRPRARGSR